MPSLQIDCDELLGHISRASGPNHRVVVDDRSAQNALKLTLFTAPFSQRSANLGAIHQITQRPTPSVLPKRSALEFLYRATETIHPCIEGPVSSTVRKEVNYGRSLARGM